MKKTIHTLCALAMMSAIAAAQTQTTDGKKDVVDGVAVEAVAIQRDGAYITVDMTLDLSALDVDGNRAVLLTPRLAHGTDTLELASVGIYGRRRYYFYVRNGGSMLSGKDERSYMAARKPDTLTCHDIVTFQEWMDGATLSLNRSDWGCCNTMLARQQGTIGTHREDFFPMLIYIRPQAQAVKTRVIEGSAFIDFPVDKTDIRPDYRNNDAELGKILATIDSVRNDDDVTITSVWLKGYASPESPYRHNTQLAMGRTEALKRHILRLYDFEEGIISTDYEPEDWEGLRRYVEKTNLEHRSEILELIDTDMDPDAREWKIKNSYTDEYRFLMDNCYPALRHTDYRIAYTVRTYTDVELIRTLIRTQPQKLSLEEFYLAAQDCEPGTEEFTEVFETAVRMFPEDTVANLNAANAAMRRGDNAGAARYLERAGDSPEAVYARGALAVRMKDYETARKFLEEAVGLGMEQAATTLRQLDGGRR